MIIKQFLDVLSEVGEFEMEKLKYYFQHKSSLNERLFFTSDSRKVNKNSVFIAIKGEKVNGHDFVNQSLKNGAFLAIIEDAGDYKGLCLKVDNVVDFINTLASYLYKQYSGFSIAITGSNGKTTTKEWVKNILSHFLNHDSIFTNKGNMNTDIGLPICILNDLSTKKRLSVLEMGMAKKGDIEYLVDYYKPNFPVILNIGTAHIGNTGSLENTFFEKSKILKYQLNSEPFCLNQSDPLLRNYLKTNPLKHPVLFGFAKDKITDFSGVYLEKYKYKIDKKQFLTDIKITIIHHGKETIVNETLKGIYHQGQLLNLCASLAIVVSLDYEIGSIPNLSTFLSQVNNRFVPEFVGRHLYLKDCYNSSLESLNYALEILKEFKRAQLFSKSYCVLGSIAETGEYNSDIHEKIGKLLNKTLVDTVFLYVKDPSIIGINKHFKGQILTFNNIGGLSKEINKRKKTDKKSVFLFKASRSIQLEEVFDHVMDVIN